jgi:hypothetical protein
VGMSHNVPAVCGLCFPVIPRVYLLLSLYHITNCVKGLCLHVSVCYSVLLYFSKYCCHICCQKSLVTQNNTKTQLLSYQKTRPFHGHCLFKNIPGFSIFRPVATFTGQRTYHFAKSQNQPDCGPFFNFFSFCFHLNKTPFHYCHNFPNSSKASFLVP